jgi:PAS domain S-box-containing protein
LFGYASREIIGKHVGILLPERYKQSKSINHFDTLDASQMAGGFELFCIKKDGNEFPVEVRLSPLKTSEGPLTTAAIRNITERRKAELALKVMEQEILKQKIQEQKKIARAIIKAQEKERNRIGQELHDNVNQILGGTKLYLEMAREDEIHVQELIKRSIELIQKSITEIRLLSSINVTPLKNINLQQLLQFLSEGVNASSGIKINIDYDVRTQVIEDDLKLNIYRIIQELINNIVKHSYAMNASILVKPDGGNIHIIVADDGKGFDVEKKRKGIGISNMINRVEAFNGEVHIESSVGKGCKMQITLPYS